MLDCIFDLWSTYMSMWYLVDMLYCWYCWGYVQHTITLNIYRTNYCKLCHMHGSLLLLYSIKYNISVILSCKYRIFSWYGLLLDSCFDLCSTYMPIWYLVDMHYCLDFWGYVRHTGTLNIYKMNYCNVIVHYFFESCLHMRWGADVVLVASCRYY